MNKHLIDAELQAQLYLTVRVQIPRTVGSWEAVILTQQAETLARFLSHPHAISEFRRVYMNELVHPFGGACDD